MGHRLVTEEWDAEVEDGGGLSCGVSEHALCHQAAHVIASCSSLSLARFPAPRIICCLAASCGQDRGMHSGSHSCPAFASASLSSLFSGLQESSAAWFFKDHLQSCSRSSK